MSRAQLTGVLSLPEGATAHGIVGRLGFRVRVVLDLDLDNNRQSPDGYFGNGVFTPTGMM